jgi:hypothetical protein
MSTPWYDFPITQAHGGAEQGVDYGVPFHTPLTALLPGVVSRILTGIGWGAEVDVSTVYQGRPVTESFLHVDQPAVQVGQQLSVGSLIGLSGGQTSGGTNNDWAPFSTGPHTEFDLFQGGPWQNPLDPTSFVASFASGGPQQNPIDNIPVLGGVFQATSPSAIWGTVTGAGAAAQQAVSSGQAGLASIGAGIASIPSSIGHGLAGALGATVHDIGAFARNQAVPLIVALVVALVIFGGQL